MSNPSKARRWMPWLVGAAVVAGVGFAAWLTWRWRSPAPSGEASFPLPPYSETRFLNTGPDARHVGIEVCAGCHQSNYHSYLRTDHSRAFARLDPKAEPPDGAFVHKPSGRSYRAYRTGSQLRHEEVLRSAEGKEMARLDLPVRYLVGSGRLARTYLVEVDGFLHESPVSWYASTKDWGMSPGYDFPQHWSFERTVSDGCLFCHSGRVEPVEGSIHRLRIHEHAIGCERCHGPGSLHADFHRSKKLQPGTADLTIVNPKRLPRDRQEAICAACHLSGAATVHLRGRGVADFRPGRPLSDYRMDYQFDAGKEQMKIVGHVEQMRLSACYQKSDMTCLTCHDPHAPERPADLPAYQRKQCLSCHTAEACTMEHSQRLRKEPRDNCVTCHMPRSDTDIPHNAATHHRIGLHPVKAPPAKAVPELVPMGDVSRLPPVDRKRNLGLAYLLAADEADDPALTAVYADRAKDLLEAVLAAGLRDGATVEALARIYWSERKYERARDLAEEALAAEHLPTEVRDNALYLLARYHVQDDDVERALPLLEKLLRLRRRAEDWRLLGECRLREGRPQQALEALQHALSIRPTHPNTHAWLAQVYLRLGDAGRAREHQAKAQWLTEHSQE